MTLLAVDLFCGKGGWTIGLQAAGWRVVGFDIERHADYPGELVLQDVATIDGRPWRGRVDLITASPPCQEYSYMAMPWSRAKAKAAHYREHPELIESKLNVLFRHCFRIAEEAGCPLIVENVRGAQPWVGPAKWNYASFYLWGDVPALMPVRFAGGLKVPGMNFHDHEKTGKPGRSFQSAAVAEMGVKNGNDWFGSGANCSEQRRHSSRSSARKEASARIAMIPYPLAKWIGEVFLPGSEAIGNPHNLGTIAPNANKNGSCNKSLSLSQGATVNNLG